MSREIQPRALAVAVLGILAAAGLAGFGWYGIHLLATVGPPLGRDQWPPYALALAGAATSVAILLVSLRQLDRWEIRPVPSEEGSQSHGLLVFSDVLAETKTRLGRLDRQAQAAFAAACATRLMSAYRRRPAAGQRPFALEWAARLDDVWEALLHDAPNAALDRVCLALAEFRAGPYSQDGGPEDADEDAAAASIFAAEALCERESGAAYRAAQRLADGAYFQVEAIVHGTGSGVATPADDIAVFAHPLVQAELRRLLDGLTALENAGTASANLLEIRRSFEVG